MDRTRSEENIRALVAKAVASNDAAEIELMMNELRAALREYIHQTKTLALSSWESISPRNER
jgi:hypothetical protein